jgi:hypothetical protein
MVKDLPYLIRTLNNKMHDTISPERIVPRTRVLHKKRKGVLTPGGIRDNGNGWLQVRSRT